MAPREPHHSSASHELNLRVELWKPEPQGREGHQQGTWWVRCPQHAQPYLLAKLQNREKKTAKSQQQIAMNADDLE